MKRLISSDRLWRIGSGIATLAFAIWIKRFGIPEEFRIALAMGLAVLADDIISRQASSKPLEPSAPSPDPGT
jgi:hypothetical protein